MFCTFITIKDYTLHWRQKQTKKSSCKRDCHKPAWPYGRRRKRASKFTIWPAKKKPRWSKTKKNKMLFDGF